MYAIRSYYALKGKIGDAKIKKVEKEEVRAVVQVVTLKKPVVVYEAEFVKGGKTYEIVITSYSIHYTKLYDSVLTSFAIGL